MSWCLKLTCYKTATGTVMHFTVAVAVAFLLTGGWRMALAIGLVEPFVRTFASPTISLPTPIALGPASVHSTLGGRRFMKHYRVNKLAKADGAIVKKKDIVAAGDKQAVQAAREDDDCPVCDVWHAGQKVGSIT